MPRPATPSGAYFGAFAPIAFEDGSPVGLEGLQRDEIRVDGQLYMERFYLSPDKSRRLHHILLSDPGTDLHDHPWDFVSVILTGAYRETTQGGDVDYSAPSVIARKAEMLHRLTLLDGPMWTMVTTGPVRRRWGFQTAKGWVHWSEHKQLAMALPNAIANDSVSRDW